MADVLRAVTFSTGGRPVELLNLDQIEASDYPDFVRMRGTFRFTPAPPQQQVSDSNRRYGGGRVVGETHGNATISWQALVKGTSYDDAAFNAEQLLQQVDSVVVGRYIEWLPDGMTASRASYFKVVGSGTWEPGYEWAQWQGSTAMPVTITIPVAPLVEWARPKISDDFSLPTTMNLFPNGRLLLSVANWATSLSGFSSPTFQYTTMPDNPDQFAYLATGIKDLNGSSATIGVQTTPTKLIPVSTDPISASVEVYTNSSSTNFGVRIALDFYSANGVFISTTQGPIVDDPEGKRLRIKLENVLPPVAGYVVARGEALTNTSGEVTAHYYTRLMVVRGKTAPNYADSGSTIPDYTFDLEPVPGSVMHGEDACLVPSLSSGLTTERHTRHTARGYKFRGGQASGRFVPAATITSFKGGVKLRASLETLPTYLEVYVDDNGTNSRLRLDKVIASTRTNIASTNLAARITSDTPFWVRGRIEEDVVFAEHFGVLDGDGRPSPMLAPTTSLTPYVLTTAERVVLPPGETGWSWIPQHINARMEDFTYDPYVYRDANLPELVPITGVPGNAPALAEVTLTSSGGSNAPWWAMIAWTPKRRSVNLVWNGFGGSTSGFRGSGTYLTGTTTLSVNSTTAKFGISSLQGVTPATSGSGLAFDIYGRFRRGVVYTWVVWLRSAAQTTTTTTRLGDLGATDQGTGVNLNLSTTWTMVTGTWIPTADREGATLSTTIGAATATTFTVDGVMVYEGTDPPFEARQREGVGQYAPFGLLEAESAYAAGLVLWTITSDGTMHGGFDIRRTVAGAETLQAQWFIEPSALVPDDFTEGEIDLEIWARICVPTTLVSPKIVTRLVPREGTALGAVQYTHEYGTTGKLLAASGTTNYRPYRLGTITAPADSLQASTSMLVLEGSTGTGSTGRFAIDYLWIVAIRSRALLPTGVENDSSYPSWVAATSEIQKTVRSDLSAYITSSTWGWRNPTTGMGGSLIEPSAGDVDVFIKLSDQVPDDPTPTSTEQLTHQASVQIDVIPRSRLMRSE